MALLRFGVYAGHGEHLLLFGQPPLLYTLSLTVNEDIRSRVTYSAKLAKLAPDDMRDWVLRELDRVALAHNVFTPEALDLIVRLGYGYRLADDGTRVVRDPREQNTIRRLKRLRRTRSLRELAVYCDAHGIRARYSAWSAVTLSRLFRREAARTRG